MVRLSLRSRPVAVAGAAVAAVAVVVLVVVLLARGGGDHQGGGGAAGAPIPGRSATPAVNPLTGLSPGPSGPVVAVKIDNTAAGRPQWGLNEADVVYVGQAEGGLTRLLVVYASHRPGQVGPVRSVRKSDVELLAQYGPVALAFSGGSAGEFAHFRSSPLVDASAGAQPAAYHRVSSRPAPYNLVLDVAAVSRAVSSAAGVRDVGFRWAATDPRLSTAPAVQRFVATVGSTPVSFRWDGKARWVQTRGEQPVLGADGAPVSTSNVLVQYCRVSVDRSNVDPAGAPAAYTHTVGSGRAVLYRDGRRVEGTWSRARPADPTRFTGTDGHELLLRPGGAWVLLAPAGTG